MFLRIFFDNPFGRLLFSPLQRIRRRRRRTPLQRFMHLLAKVLAGWLLLTLLVLVLFRYVNPPTWSLRIERYLQPPAQAPAHSRAHWVSLTQIPPSLQLAVIASEDQRFPLHDGVDLHAITQAVDTALDGGRLRGASTLTQQTVKNLFLWPGRDWLRKGIELPLALLMEQVWNKHRILEVYLNIVEFGPGVYGVDAASRYWFGRPVSRLTREQAARLAAILPNPWRYRARPPSPYVLERSRWILRQMDQLGESWLARLDAH